MLAASRAIESCDVIRISITSAAFKAIAATLPLGSVGFDREAGAKDERLVWLAATVVDPLTAIRGPEL
jgi:hypothetical protein